MIRLHESLPNSITVGGKRYCVDFDFRNVLKMIDILGQDDLLPETREFLALRCVIRYPPKDTKAALSEIKKIIFPEKQTAPSEKLTDYDQDADLIRAAFLQSYGINLWRDRLHWLEFIGLLSSLPSGSRYADIINIRARPMPAPTAHNQAEREWLAKAKATHAVRLSEKEMQTMLQNSLHSTTASLLALAEKRGRKK